MLTMRAPLPLPPALRAALPWLAGVALLVLAALAWQSVAERDALIEQALRKEVTERVEERVHAWERDILPRLDVMITEAAAGDLDPAVLQQRWRSRLPWFDAVFVWTADPPGGVDPAQVGAPITFLFPVGRAAQPDAAATECADSLPDGVPPADTDLDALLGACASADARAWAAREAARRIHDAGQPIAALALLNRHPPDHGELRVLHQLLRADLLAASGRDTDASALRRQVATALADLDAPGLERVLYLLPSVLDALDAAGADTGMLRTRLALAEQRLAAWREIRQAAQRSRAAVSEGARFTYDQYSSTPYLLYTRRAADSRPGVALLLRQDRLIADFLSNVGALRTALSVVDASGALIAGAADPTSRGPVVPFADSLRHLQVRVSERALDARLQPVRGVARVWVSAIVLACIALGLFALWAGDAANRRHQLLLLRQADFTARVTHELKTPLAGIRLMAENLSIGAFRDDVQRAEMAERIVDEADRLTARVEEVLQLSKRRELPEPELFDIEEPLMELIDAWGPRYEQHGVTLSADLAPVDPVRGDPDAFRDAIACLLDNALKYRREDIDSAVWLNVRDDGAWAEIEVVDNGIGVPPSHRQSIFEKFVRVEGPNRGRAGGHGLGLAQVADIVRAHGGTVRCDTGIDGGSRFVVRVPIAAS